MKNAISWFEIPSLNLEKAQQFYESMLQIKMQPMTMGPSECAIFPYEEAAGGRVALPRTALPPGMGFMASIFDSDGNKVGLHSLS